jgi:hypothetical protein
MNIIAVADLVHSILQVHAQNFVHGPAESMLTLELYVCVCQGQDRISSDVSSVGVCSEDTLLAGLLRDVHIDHY